MRSILKVNQTILFILLSLQYVFCMEDSQLDGLDHEDPGFTATFVNVGQGNGLVVVDHRDGHRVFIDAGSSKRPTSSTAYANIHPFLEISPLVLSTKKIIFSCSHPDKDHLNLFPRLLKDASNHIATNENIYFYLGGPLKKYFTSKESKKFLDELIQLNKHTYSLSHKLSLFEIRDVSESLEALETQLGIADGYESMQIAKERKIDIKLSPFLRPFILRSKVSCIPPDNRIRVEVLAANAGHSLKKNYSGINSFENDDICGESDIISNDGNLNSCLIRLIFYNQFSMIVTGDATGITTDRLIRQYFHDPLNEADTSLQCDVLLACHHGAITHESNNYEFAQALKPKYVIFSAGKYGGYCHPQFDAIYNYAKNPRILQAQPTHTITCARSNGRQIKHSNYDFISADAQDSGDEWKTIKTSHTIYSTYDSGSIPVRISPDKLDLSF